MPSVPQWSICVFRNDAGSRIVVPGKAHGDLERRLAILCRLDRRVADGEWVQETFLPGLKHDEVHPVACRVARTFSDVVFPRVGDNRSRLGAVTAEGALVHEASGLGAMGNLLKLDRRVVHRRHVTVTRVCATDGDLWIVQRS